MSNMKKFLSSNPRLIGSRAKFEPLSFIRNQMLIIIFCLLSNATVAQVTVTGSVNDDGGNAIAGASVNLKGTQVTTSTDDRGKYSIVCPDLKGVLVVSSVGFSTLEAPLNNRQIVNIELIRSDQALSEVIVTGYTSQQKKDITGSVSVVDMKSIKSVPTGSALQALQGQAAGVNVITSGVPGDGSFVTIRGISSFGSVSPLVLIDGVEADLRNVSATDIESIQVLKDAGAASIYGVRGSNGVIIVTTKKGKQGAPVITYDAYYGMQYPLSGNPFNLLNSEDFMKVALIANPGNSIFKNGMPDYLYAGPGVSGAVMEGDPAADPSKYSFSPINRGTNYLIQKVNKTGTDWFHETFKPAPTTSHSLTASGATEKANYLASFDYYDQQGTLIKTYAKRYTARINTAFKIKKNIRIGENASILYRDAPGFGNQAEFGTLADVFKMMPIIPVYDIEGNFGGTWAGPDLGSNANPVAMRYRTVNNRARFWNIVGNAFAEVDFLRNFSARTSIGINVANSYNQNFSFTQYDNKQGNNTPNSYSEGASFGSTSTWTNLLSYKNLFGKHDVKFIFGSEAIRYSGRSVSGSRVNFFSSDYDYLVLGNGTENPSNSSSGSINTLFSVFSRLDYSFNDKYLIAVTARRDGSSRFGPDNRYGFFPSISLGWRVSDEVFMKEVSWINDLKLRGSYGILGSQNNVDPYNQFSLYGGGYGNAYYDITGTSNSVQQGFIQTRIGNSITGWEKDKITNLGFDATILNNHLTINLEYYKKSISGLLFTQPLPATVGGATYPVINIGDIQNQGVDASVGYNGKLSNQVGFSIGTNFTSYKNQVVKIPNPGYFFAGSLQGLGSIAINKVGEPVSAFYGYDVLGLFNSDTEVASSPAQSGAGPGRFKYRDVDGDGSITPDDRTILGSPNPDFTYGVNIGLTYKGFDLSAIIYGSQGNEIVNTTRSYLHFWAGYVNNKSNVLLNAWSPKNTNTTVPIIENGVNMSTAGVMNSYFIENGSFLKFKSMMLGYTVERKLLNRIGINNIRLYVQGVNLFTITKYTGLDPELGGSSSAFGIDYGNYPNNERVLIFGINASF